LYPVIFFAAMGKSVNGQPSVKRVEGADEDHVGRVQFLVRFALVQQLSINQALVETAAFGQVIPGGIGTLHFDVVNTAFIVFHEDIQADAFALQTEIDGFFETLVLEGTDLDVQELFNQMFAKPFIAHDMLKEKIVPDGEFVKGFDSFHRLVSLKSWYGEFLLNGTEKILPNWKKKVIIGHFTGMNGIWG